MNCTIVDLVKLDDINIMVIRLLLCGSYEEAFRLVPVVGLSLAVIVAIGCCHRLRLLPYAFTVVAIGCCHRLRLLPYAFTVRVLLPGDCQT